jgi:hypothetical protein
MYAYCNTEAYLDLCILDSSQMVIPFNPLGSHILCCSIFKRTLKYYYYYYGMLLYFL